MKELFEAAFSGVNLIPTVLLLLILVYWVFVILGALDMDFLNVEVETGDVDIDVDVDADLDVDTDVDVDADADGSIGSVAFLNSILVFFNLGKMPFMVWLSFVIMPMWVISVLMNYYLNSDSFVMAMVYLIPNLVVSLIIAKVLTTPIAYIFRKIEENEEDNFKYNGKVCKVLMQADHEKYGQAEISLNGSIYRVTILTKEEGVVLHKGETGLVIEYLEDKKCYLIEPYKL